MKNVPHLPPLAIIAIALLVPACRSTRNITSTQLSTTAITQKEMDIATRNAVTTCKRKLTITYIPMLPTTPKQNLTPQSNTPTKELADHLIYKGGGTLIIEEETTQTEGQTANTTQMSTQDTTTTQNSQYHETTPKQPRASPNLKLILYILLAAIAFLLLLKCRNRQ